jgi:hypothetical protein
MKFYETNDEENQTIICKPMQSSKLLANNFTKTFTIYKSIYKGQQKSNVMLECKWVLKTQQPPKKKNWKEFKLIKIRNIQRKKFKTTIKLLNKKSLKKHFFFSFLTFKFPKLNFQVFQAPTYTWQEEENTTPQQATITQRRVKWVHEWVVEQ